MATLTTQPRQSLRQRFLEHWRAVFAPGDVLTLIAAIALLFMPALALADAGWNLSLRVLLPAAALSVLIGFGLARSRYDELFALLLSLLYGVCIVLILAAISLSSGSGGLFGGIAQVFSRFIAWLIDVFSAGINQDDLVFTLLVGMLFWSIGFNLAWHLFRIDRLWRAVMPPAFVLLINTIYYTGENNLDRYLIVFTLLVLLLLVRSNLEARAWDWYLKGIRVPRALRRQVFIIGTILTLIVMGVAWIAPRSTLQDRLNRFQELLQAQPLQELAELWNRLFTAPETQGTTTSDYYGSDSLQLGGAIRLGDGVVFTAQAARDRRYYWRSRTFDNYDFGRWTSSADTRLTDPEAPLDITQDTAGGGARTAVQQTFTFGQSASRLIYAAPQPASIDVPTRSDLRYAPDNSMNISVIRPLRVIDGGQSYSATSLMSDATGEQLRNAGTAYPQWVRDGYNSYIPTATGRTIELAARIIREANATTPYDQARAIERWLRNNITYNEVIPAPPLEQDPVDWVLFDLHEGYCNYYASAMIVMLRSQGIPARMAAGFAQGEYDSGVDGYVVRERDAHTWVEVYFPGYGWIEFEPTSAQAPVTRDDEPPEPATPNPAAIASLTPAPTETLPPTPTPVPPTETAAPGADGSAPTATPENNAAASLVPPSPTPTFMPTATQTPAPAAPPEAPPRPPQSGIVQLLLAALSAVLVGLGVLLVLLLIGAVVYWYWEWRGLRGMNPVARIYIRLQRYAALLGIRPSEEQTPEERRGRIVRAVPVAELPVTAITRLYSDQRYGAMDEQPANEPRTLAAQRAWSDARGNIVSRWLRQKLMFWRR